MKKNLSKLSYLILTLVFFISVNSFFITLCLNNNSYFNDIWTINYVKNTGAAFSILQNFPTLLIGISIAAIILILLYVFRYLSKLQLKEILFISLLLAGIGGNLYERITLGFVRDFIDLNIIDFPIFNFSDIFINVAVVAIILITIATKRR